MNNKENNNSNNNNKMSSMVMSSLRMRDNNLCHSYSYKGMSL